MKFDDAAACLQVLGNPTRLKIYRLLVRTGADGLAVGRLREKLDSAGSTLSHHLKSLIGAGLVIQTRQGTTLTCRSDGKRMREVIHYVLKECSADAR